MTDYVWADQHFSHKNILKFTREDGSPLRHFQTLDEMDQTLIDNCNEIVKEGDRLFFLGDVVMNKNKLPLLKGIKCHNRILVGGNHCVFPVSYLQPYFNMIVGCMEYKGCLLSHVPVHPCNLNRFKLSIHGHLHDGQVYELLNPKKPDPRYVCVSVEHTNYKPVNLTELIQERLDAII